MSERNDYDAREELRMLESPDTYAPKVSPVVSWIVTALLLGALAAIFLWPEPLWPQEQEPPLPLVEDGVIDLGLLQEALRTGDWSGIDVPEPRPSKVGIAALMERAGANPGVGLTPPATACFEGGADPRRQRSYQVDPSARPWGALGIGRWQGNTVMRARYSQGNPETGWHCGMAAELFWMNQVALENAFAGRCSAISLATAGRDGGSTLEEQNDFGYGRQRCDNGYFDCAVRLGIGGSPENPIVIGAGARGILETYGLCSVGLHSVPSNLRACSAWKVYYLVESLPEDRPWCTSVEPPPPPPPPPEPTCTDWPESAWIGQCSKLAVKNELDLAGAELCAWCEPKGKDGTHLARLREGVCEPVVCEAEEEPPPVEDLCPRFRVIVTPEVITLPREYIPEEASSGRLELELVPQEWGPCE